MKTSTFETGALLGYRKPLRRQGHLHYFVFKGNALGDCWDSWVDITTRYGLEVRGLNPGRGEIFRTRLDGPGSQSSLPYGKYRVSFPYVKRPVRGVNYSLSSSAEVKERVELLPLWAFMSCSRTNFILGDCDSCGQTETLCMTCSHEPQEGDRVTESYVIVTWCYAVNPDYPYAFVARCSV